jgi:hypothetical protein
MIDLTQAFSTSYGGARRRFLEAAAAAGLHLASFAHPLRGIEGEDLALDVAYAPAVSDPGAAAERPERLLIVSSACHGIEGYCGSGVQVFALHDAAWLEAAQAAGVSVLFLHALNPYGFSFGRRVTHENVDLNRNFQDFAQPLPDNPEYRSLHPWLLPEHWPPDAAHEAGLQRWIRTHGGAAYQAAVTRGQYEFPDGLFFGGHAPTWSHVTLRSVLRRWGRGAQRLAWIDLHTGLGPQGIGERIFAGRNDPSAIARARRWWGPAVTSIYDGSSSSALLTGLMWNAAYEECPQAEYTGIALEYGTEPIEEVTEALRAEQWLHQHPEADATTAVDIRRRMRAAFYTETPEWKAQVVSQARQALFQALDGLAHEQR